MGTSTQRAALTSTQTRNGGKFSRTITGALQQMQDQLGEGAAVALAIFDEQQEVPLLKESTSLHVWMVVGNFGLQDDAYPGGGA